MDGKAIVYCEGAFNTPNGKTAHGLVRFTHRYEVMGVIDSRYSGADTGEILDNKPNGIPVFASLDEAIAHHMTKGIRITYLVIGLAPDGGRLPNEAKEAIKKAIIAGMHIDSGLHDFLSDDPDIVHLAEENQVILRDIRKPPSRNELHFFSGKIEQVNCLKLAVLGTDSALGKRTTAWILVHALRSIGIQTEMIGTGQTAWMQGAKYSIVLDSLVNDFVSGEIEHAVYSAWKNENPQVIIIEGQGSLMNPAYPGGFEILAAGRPQYIILQHAPARAEYDGFPGYPIHPLKQQIEAIEMLSGKKVLAVTINHENLPSDKIPDVVNKITDETGLPAFDVLLHGSTELAAIVLPLIKKS